jgi:hypothetical protein
MANAIAILSQPFPTPDGNPKVAIIGNPDLLLVANSNPPIYRVPALGVNFEVAASSISFWVRQASTDADGTVFNGLAAEYIASLPAGAVFDARA